MNKKISLLIFALALQGCVVGTKKRYRENVAFSFAAGMIEANRTCLEKFNGLDPVSAAYKASNEFLRKQIEDCNRPVLKTDHECTCDCSGSFGSITVPGLIHAPAVPGYHPAFDLLIGNTVQMRLK